MPSHIGCWKSTVLQTWPYAHSRISHDRADDTCIACWCNEQSPLLDFKMPSGASVECVAPDEEEMSCSWDRNVEPSTGSSTCSRIEAAAPPKHLNATALALPRVTIQDTEKGPNPFESLLLQSFGSSNGSPASACSSLRQDRRVFLAP